MKSIIFALSLTLATVSGSGTASAQSATAISTFGCDEPAGHQCFFAISNAKGSVISRLTVPGGSRTPMLLPTNENQTYVVTVDKDFTKDSSCNASCKGGVFCKYASVVRGFNN